MKKLIVLLVSIVLLASCFIFPERTKGGNILTSPQYWFFPGNTYGTMYGDNETDNRAPTSISPPTSSTSDSQALAIVAVIVAIGLIMFCGAENQDKERERNR